MNCSNTTEKLAPSFQTFSLITYIPLFVFGIICNILAVWVFCFRLKKWTETTVFMVNLMLADILVLLTFPFRIYAFSHRWDLGSGLCKTVTSAYYVNMYMSIFTITSIAFDRYLAIIHPLKYKAWMSKMKAAIMCCVLWTILIIISILRTLQSNDYILFVCFQKVTKEPFNMSLVFVLVGFVLPLILISFFSGKVIMTLCVTKPVNINKQCSIKKPMNIIISNLVIFVVCFLPIHLGYTIRFVAESFNASCYTREQVNFFINLATVIANSNCVLDTLCYYFAASEFWGALYRQKITLSNCHSLCLS